MGSEFGQGGEWAFEGQLDWWLLDSPFHKGVLELIKDLNLLNKSRPAIYEKAFENDGFEWVAYDDNHNSVISYHRKGNEGTKPLLVVCSMTPQVLQNYEIGTSFAGQWKEILNTDDKKYGGSGNLNGGDLNTNNGLIHGREQSLKLTLAPLAVMVFELEKEIVKPRKKELVSGENEASVVKIARKKKSES